MLYHSVLKLKDNDLKSFSFLPNEYRQIARPLLEVLRPKKSTNIERHIGKAIDTLLRFRGIGPCSLDCGYLPPRTTIDGKSASLIMNDAARANGILVTPVVTLDLDIYELGQYEEIVAANGRGALVRILFDDIEQTESTIRALNNLQKALALAHQQIDIVVDFGHFGSRSVEYSLQMGIRFLKPILDIGYRSISVGGSSALKYVTPVPEDDERDVDRVEARLWMHLLQYFGARPNFALLDYGIVHPDHMDDIKNKYINGKLRYTTGMKIRYFRGKNRIKASLASQYPDLIKRVVESKVFKGPDYSSGDNHLFQSYKCGLRNNDLGQWIFCDNNHHLNASIRQMVELNKISRSASITEMENTISGF
jgi:hypothetical protein